MSPQKLRGAIEQWRRGSAFERPIRRTIASASGLDTLPAIRLAQLQAVYDGAPVGLGFLDRELRYVNVNRVLAEMHRVPIEEHLGRSLPELRPAKFAQIAPYLERALAGESVANVEFTDHHDGAGPPRTYLGSYEPARDEANEIVGVSCAVVDFTERKTAELRLRQFESVVEGLDEMIAVADPQYRIVLANRSFLDYVGKSADQCIGRLIPEVVGQEAFEHIIGPRVDECLAGKHVEYEMKWTHPRWGERELGVSYSPLGNSGESRTVVAVVRDVTNARRLEELQMTSQRRIEMAERAGLPLGLWDWDLKTNRAEWSSEMFRQWGIDRGSFSGRPDDFMGRIHAEDRAAVDRVMRRALARETERYSVQFRIVRPDASIAWVEVQGVVLSARSERIVGLSLDITELKKVQESLRTSKENYLRLLNSAAEGIYAVDPDGNCTFCNAACVQLLGYSSTNDLLGKNMHAVMHHTHANGQPYPEEECSIYKPIRDGAGSHIAGEVLWRADGTSFPVEMWSYPMYGGEKFLGAVVSFFDISGRQQPGDDRVDSYSARKPTMPN